MSRRKKECLQRFQNKYLPRSLLDFKARLILGKTQFNNSMAHWIGENKSQNCIWCAKNGNYSPSNFIHTLFTCSAGQAVLQNIKKPHKPKTNHMSKCHSN